MTREQYRAMRESNELDALPFYEFYLDNLEEGKQPLPLQAFDQLFKAWIDRPDVDANKVIRKVVEELDRKHNIVILADREGRQLKVY